MPTRLRALALMYFLFYCRTLCAQSERDVELLALPPIEGEFAEESVAATHHHEELPSIMSPSQRVGWAKHFIDESRAYWNTELIVFESSWGPSFKDDTLAAVRGSLGWEHDSGYGVRGRHLGLNSEWNVLNSPLSTPIVDPDPGDIQYYAPHFQGALLLSREIDNLNLDLYKRLALGRTQLLVGTGLSTVRNIERFQRVFDETPPGGDYSYDFADDSIKGIGVGLVGELKQPIFVRDTLEVAFLLNGRTSYVPVEAESQSQLVNFHREYDLWIHEGHIGLEVLKRVENLAIILRSQYETQHWESDFSDARGFDGVSFSVGLAW